MLRAEGVAVAQQADHVKAAGCLPGVVRRQPGLRRAREDTLFGRGHGRCRAAALVRPPGFDLHKDQNAAFAADHIQLQAALPPVAVQQLKARAPQKRGRNLFAVPSQADVVRRVLARRGRHLRAGLPGKKPFQHKLPCSGAAAWGNTPRNVRRCCGQGPRRRKAA